MSTSAFQPQDFLRTRRSVRRFDARPVPADVLRRVLESGTWAPSAHNRQPWRFAVLSAQADRRRLADGMGAAFGRDLLNDGLPQEKVQIQVERSRARILNAPVVVVLCLTMVDMDDYPDRRRRRAEFRMALQSVALAGGQILLAAHGEGLAGVWVCAPLFAPQAAAASLALPADWEPQGMLLLGYPAAVPAARPRKPLDEVALFFPGEAPHE